MSLWEFNAVAGGYVKANSSPDEQGLSKDEAKRLADFIDAPPVWH
jgi:hypothetical protein